MVLLVLWSFGILLQIPRWREVRLLRASQKVVHIDHILFVVNCMVVVGHLSFTEAALNLIILPVHILENVLEVIRHSV